MVPEYAWTERRYNKGFWCITEVIERNGVVEEHDWGFYKRSMETRIEAVAEILDEYPDAKFDSWFDQWYLVDRWDYKHYFIIWNESEYIGPWGPKWDELKDDIEDDNYYFYDEEEEDDEDL